MTRSIWKGPFVDTCLFKQKKIRWRIWSRRSCILPQFVGCYAQIYNGKGFVGLRITEEMVGHKFGEFASTRKTSSLGKRTLPSKTRIKPIKKVR
uniref:Small ribosomal subunit protein uS19m n=1 Tax=Nowellia curvifolia TaxID=280839 RepID=A0A6C0SLF7_9MARC|nr:ribosomal protein S19 [Nowellia curvifolia]QIA60624.1 ribosomal protein S19 [Nowellia curvifolia]UQM88608.1 ribosomal protein S19 [Nowellia curvifolia]